jgi:flagellar hook-length control protein FliK
MGPEWMSQVAAEQTSGRGQQAGAMDRLVALHTVAQTAGGNSTFAASSAAAPAEVPGSYSSADRFLAGNATSIVSGVRTQLLGSGGKMTLRLDPPELGALQVAVVMKDGLASIQFSAENGEAARLITSTLSQLRDTLSAAGLTVDRLSVQQSVKPERSGSESQSGAGGQPGQGYAAPDEQARRDQQRRDQFERMWRRASGDDVNVFA